MYVWTVCMYVRTYVCIYSWYTHKHTCAAVLADQNKTLQDNLSNTQAKLKAALDELDKLRAKLDEMCPK